MPAKSDKAQITSDNIAMILQITKKAMQPKPVNFILSVMLAGILWFLPEITGLSHPVADTPFLLFGRYTAFSLPSDIARIAQFVIYIGIWFYVMTICENLKVIPVRSIMPLMAGIILTSSVSYTQYFDHNTVAFALFLLAFRQLLSMYSIDNRLPAAFNITLLLSLAALLNPRYALLLPLFLLGMFIFRAFSFRILMAGLTGLLLPAFMLLSGLYLTDNTDTLGTLFPGCRLYDFSYITIPLSNIFLALSLIIASAISLISYFVTSINYTLNVRLNFTLINCSFLLSLGWVVLFLQDYAAIITVPLFFIVLCLSLYFSTHHNKVSSLLFLLFIMVCVAYRILWIFGL